MDELQAISERHAVRAYLPKPIERALVNEINADIEQYNKAAGIHLQLVTDSGDAFRSVIPAFGRFKGVNNYIAMVAKNTKEMQEKCGYYGAKLAIKAQMLGLNTCFVTGSYKAAGCKVSLDSGEEILGVIAIGYGRTSGSAHKSKKLDMLGKGDSEWFNKGLTTAALAPTGLNRQNFYLEEKAGGVIAKTGNDKDITWMDLGIVKYHFEVGAGKDSTIWLI